jgi:hypothetical protein
VASCAAGFHQHRLYCSGAGNLSFSIRLHRYVVWQQLKICPAAICPDWAADSIADLLVVFSDKNTASDWPGFDTSPLLRISLQACMGLPELVSGGAAGTAHRAATYLIHLS